MDSTDHKKFLIGNYASPALEIVRGEGAKLWDSDHREFLDFTSGIAVTNLGHCHPHWTEQVTKQAGKIVHCSNLFSIPEQVRLAKRLVTEIGPGKMLFCNSGAEANEGLIKFARLASETPEFEGKRKILAAENAFHGRTMGALSATASPKYRKGFEPLLDGFEFAPLNDLEAWERKLDDKTVAVLIESIQGEGGIYEAQDHFLQGLEKICRERKALLMIDEVQSGIGRTGDFLAYQQAGISPDAVALAKGLGGGFPIGAFWISDQWSGIFKPGSHGTTFGGSPLACAAAHAVLDVIENDGLVGAAREKGQIMCEGLTRLVQSFPAILEGVRGRGLMLALALKIDPTELISLLRDKGLLVVGAAGNTIRFLPPLNVSDNEIDQALKITEEVLESFQNKQSE
jgi:acetylornithine aminotransferase/acetylornithine/N-succinyldiaminopimelate aminotransferase